MSSPFVELRTSTIAAYLSGRGPLDPKERGNFLDPKLNALTPPHGMRDRQLAAERIASAIKQRQRMVVFGDYDCDGMTATAIVTEVVRTLGGEVQPLLASRFQGGYGVSDMALERIIAQKPHLVVTCDCGSSDHKSLQVLRTLGIDVIVIDHHLVPEEPLPVLAFLNPHRPECAFPFKGLASCGLALSVMAELRKQLGVELDIRNWLDLVAIGTIADVAPLSGDNRILVRAGLAKLKEAQRPGLRALMALIGMNLAHPLTASDVAFRLAPRINAPGRLQAPDQALLLMLERDPDKAQGIASKVEQLCQQRRAEQARILELAEAQLSELEREPGDAIVVGHEGWNHGIVGIVAGRLAELHQCPTIVVGFEDGRGRGSVRGPAGFPLFDAVAECEAHLLRFGGHQAAAGLEIEREQLEAFRSSFVGVCRNRTYAAPAARLEPLLVHPGDRVTDLLADCYLLEPTGEGNPAPSFAFDCFIKACRSVRGGHLKFEFELDSGDRLGGFGPGLAATLGELTGRARVVGQLRPDTYRGGEAVELLVNGVTCAVQPTV